MNSMKNDPTIMLVFGLSSIIISLCFVSVDVVFGIPQEGGFDIGAPQILKERMLHVGNDINNFLILIPNEGHEPPDLPKEQRIINQPYVPENIVVNNGTTVLWLNGDVGHKHKITLVDENSNTVFDSGTFAFNDVSKPFILNKVGKFSYSESNVSKDDPNFKMKGTITVVASDNGSSNHSNSYLNKTVDTLGFLMVPTKDLDLHVSNLENKRLVVLDKYAFKDLRGGQKGTGPEQTLLILGSKEKPLTDFTTILKSITPKLPYS
jgi:plastocyanin